MSNSCIFNTQYFVIMDKNLGEDMCGNNLAFKQQVKAIKMILQQEQNPYLAGDMENLLLDVCEGNLHQLPEYFPQAFKQLFLALAKQIKELQAADSQELLRYLREQIQSIQAQEIKLRDSASLLLKLKCIKALPEPKRRSLVRMFNDECISSQIFVQYIDSLYQAKELDREQFQQQLRQHVHGNLQDFLLNVQLRPSDPNNNVGQFLQRYRRRLACVQTWILKISSNNHPQLCTEGIIVKAQLQDHLACLTLQENNKESKVTFTLNTNHINQVDFIYESEEQKINYLFKNSQSDNSSLSLAQISNENATNSVLLVQSRKKMLIKKFLEGQYKHQYEQLINQLINRQLTFHSYSNTKIYSQALCLAKLQQATGKKSTAQKSLIRLLNDANFHSFINVGCSFFTRQAVQMFKQAQQQAALLNDKQIISFYGKTGAGKSTSINHFSGITLSSRKILENTSIFEVSSKEKDLLGEYSHASIGHSFVLSDTLYSKGFSFIEERYSQDLDLKDVLLCDNPGFMDTRGEVYEIVTSYSIDRAVRACGSIKAIVLVIESSYLTSGRSTDLFESLHSLQSLFPSLLDINGSVFKHFYIFFSQKETNYTLPGIYQILCRNKSDIEKQNLKNSSSAFAVQRSSKKLSLMNALIEIYKQKRMVLIDLSENISQREQHLRKIINEPGSIDKKSFVSPINSQHLDQFIQKVLDWSQAWEKFVLTPFLREFPQKIASIQHSREVQQRSIDLLKEQKMGLLTTKSVKQRLLAEIQGKAIPTIESQLHHAKSEAQRLHSLIQEDNQYKVRESTFLSLILDERQQSLEIEKQDLVILLQKKTQSAADYQEQIKTIETKLERLGHERNKYEEKIEDLINQAVSLALYRKSFELGSTYILEEGEYIYEKQWGSYLLSLLRSRRQILVGEKEQLLIVYLDLYRNNYRFIYDESLDPKHLLQNINTTQEGGYDLVINSHNVVLKAFEVHEFKNTMHFCFHFSLPCSNMDASELPYLFIKKNIPGSQFYSDAIDIFRQLLSLNAQETLALEREKAELKDRTRQLQEQIKSLSDQRSYLQQKILAATKEKQQLLVQQSIVLELAQSKLKHLQKLISMTDNLKKQLQDSDFKLQKLEAESIEATNKPDKLLNNLNAQRNRYKRLAFLLRDQQQEGTLQILGQLAKIVIELTSENDKKAVLPKDHKKEERVQKLKQFISFYDKSKTDMQETISQLLQ